MKMRQKNSQNLELEIQNLKNQLEKQKTRVALMDKIIQGMHSTLVLDDILQIAVNELHKALNVSRCLIFRPNPEKQMVAEHISEATIEGNSLIGIKCNFYSYYNQLLSQGEAWEFTTVNDEELPEIIKDSAKSCNISAALIVPLLHQNRYIGGISLHQCDRDREWQTDEIEFVKIIATHCALAIHQAELYQQLENRAFLLITEMQNIKETKRLQKERDRFFNHSLDLMVIADFNGYFQQINPAWTKTLGYSLEELQGKHYSEFLHPEDWETVKIIESQKNSGEPIISLQNRYLSKKGFYCWLSWNIIFFPEERLMYGFARDINEHKHTENLLHQLNEELESRVQIRSNTLKELNQILLAEIADRKIAQQKLLETQEQLQAILDYSPTVIYLTDLNHKYLLINRKYENLIQAKSENVIGKNIYEFFPQKIADTFVANNQKVIETKTSIEIEEIIPQSDGIHTYLSIKFPLRNSKGVIYAVCGISTNITDRVSAENALRQNELHLRLALNAALMGTWEWNILAGEIIWSEQTEVIFGFLPGTFPKTFKAFINAVHGDDRPFVTQAISYALRDKVPYDIEYRIIHTNGSIRWVASKGDILRNQTGNPGGMRGIIMDITDRKEAEAQIRDSEFKLRTIINNSNDSISLKDINGKYLLINPAGAKFLGLTIKDILGKTDLELFTPETGEKIWQKDREVMTAKRPKTYEEIGESNGIKRTYLSTKCPYFSPQGELLGIIGICRDITASKQAENDLRESEARYRLMAENSTDMISRHDPNGIYLYASPACRILLGYEPEEIIGHSAYNFFHPEDLLTIQNSHTSILEKSDTSTIIYRILRKDGSYTWFETTSKAVYFPDNKEIQELICVSRDISDRKQVENALRESEERFRRIFQDAPIGIILNNTDGKTLLVNPAFCQLLGYTETELKETTFYKFTHPDDLAQELPYIQGCLQGEINSYKMEKRYIKKNGEIVWVNLTSGIIKDSSGKICYALGMIEDITDRKQTEERLKLRERAITASNNGIIIVDAKHSDMPIIYVNPAFEKITGYLAEEVIGKNGRFLQYNQTNQEELEKLRFAIHHGKDCSVVLRNSRKNGSLFWNELSISPIYDNQGNLTHYIGIQTDITDRKEAEEALQQAKDQLQAVLDAVPGLVSWIKSDLHYLGVNQHLAKTFNLKTEDFIGQEIGFLNSSEFTKFIKEFFTKPDLSASQVIETYANGRSRNYLIAAQKYQQGTAAVSVGIDITERKQAEERLKASLKEKEVLLKEIHHRVKNNLQIVSSLLKLQSGYIKDKEALALFKDSYNRVHSMALIHEKLYRTADLARIDVGDYIRTLLSNLFSSYGVSSIAIKLNLEIDKIFLDVDTAIPCGLIINELVSNSLKYAFPHATSGEITISFKSVNNTHFALNVSDNGIGISSDIDIEELESLGLQLVLNLIEQLSGCFDLDVTNGTSFKIQFPQTKN